MKKIAFIVAVTLAFANVNFAQTKTGAKPEKTAACCKSKKACCSKEGTKDEKSCCKSKTVKGTKITKAGK